MPQEITSPACDATEQREKITTITTEARSSGSRFGAAARLGAAAGFGAARLEGERMFARANLT